MIAPDRESGSTSDRRQVLRLLGGGTAGVYVGSGLVRARGHGGNRGGGVGPCTCEECPDGTFCAKAEGQPEAGATYEFSSDGDAYSVTIERTETNEDGEITCFEFSSDDDIQQVCVKSGPDTATYTDPEGDLLCASTNPGGQQSEISNFSFCGTPRDSVCYQVDLVSYSDDYEYDELTDMDLADRELVDSAHANFEDDGSLTVDLPP